MEKYIEDINKIWKNVMFFKFDKITKNIICFVKINKDNEEHNENIIIRKIKK